MAVRARLTPPREIQQAWPWHHAKTATLRASLLFGGDRRMEAENFLGDGFGTRRAIEARASGWQPLRTVARAWQPSRLKGIQVSPEFGSPFLAATQVFDLRPVPRKWLSLERTDDHVGRVLDQGTILLTCSGDVGRATLSHATTDGLLISHDLLRIDVEAQWKGWVYAFLRAPSIRAMMKSAQYGHIIKHLETQHLDLLPLVNPSNESTLLTCNQKLDAIVSARNDAAEKIARAETLFNQQFPALPDRSPQVGFVRKASSSLFGNRRRFDAWAHNPEALEIEHALRETAVEWESLAEIGCEIWLPNRFRRVPAEDGVELVDSSSIFEINPDKGRLISAEGIADRSGGTVEPGWLLMSRSGQVYGLLGSVALATKAHHGKVVSDDVIRLKASERIDPGYLYVALSHGSLGRPRVKSLAYGSSIPHIEVEDLKRFCIPRLPSKVEREIGDLARSAFANWATADAIEDELADTAEAEIAKFTQAS